MLCYRRCRRFIIFLLSALTLGILLVYLKAIDPINVMELIQTLTTEELFPYTNLQDDHWLLRTPGCFIPRQDPWEPDTIRYFTKLPTATCPQNAVDLLVYLNDDGFLRVNETARSQLTSQDTFYCRMWSIWNTSEEEDDNSFRLSKEYTQFVNGTFMNEYAYVKCFVDVQLVYQNYFFQVREKPEVEKKCLSNNKEHLQRNPQCINNFQMSILVLGVNSVSRTNFIRQFPLTFDLLVNNLQALDFQGYNRYGVDSAQYLHGFSEGKRREDPCSSFTNCSWLLHTLDSAGYRSAFVDNFTSFKRHKKVSAHYNGDILYSAMGDFLKSGCWRGQTDDKLTLEWATQFQQLFKDKLHFGHFWIGRFLQGNVNNAQLMDPILSNVIEDLYRRQLLNNTLLVILSNYGIRQGSFRETEAGRIEENLPFLFMKFPSQFVNSNPKLMTQLHLNRFRLVTSNDLHETLQAIIKCKYYSLTQSKSLRKSISLFQTITNNRTCVDAGIPVSYCACQQNVVQLDLDSPLVFNLSKFVINYINKLTFAHRSLCVHYQVKEIIYAKRLSNLVKQRLVSKSSSYIVAVVTEPGDAKFEVIIDEKDGNLQVKSHLRRLNQISNNKCITNDDSLKVICHCK